MEFFGADAAASSITTARIYELVKALETRKGRKGPLSPKTINRYLAVISGLLDFARNIGEPTQIVKMPWQEEDEGSIQWLKEEDEPLVAARLPSDLMRMCLHVLIRTGMRAGEFFNLAPSQVEITGNRCAWIRLRGEGTKSGKGRSQPLTDLDTARKLRDALEHGVLPDHNDFYLAFKRACSDLGLSKDLNVHSLRHTTATRLATRVAPAVVQDFMGHASYKTTQKYIHLADEARIEAAVALC